MIIVLLLPKADGGFRPIGLLPFLPRLWMRARENILTAWERDNDRPYLYAGKGSGANVAVWKQAARAKLAATASWRVGYGQALLDLVKAFDRIPHHLLAREAAALRYPLWMLRLAITTHRLTRVLKIGGTLSAEVLATRGVSVGSGSALTEMRVVLIRIIVIAGDRFPTVTPTLFVDDLSAEHTAPE